jgi:hypothetical protein
MDFFRVCTRESRKKGGPIEVYADYTVGRSKDLMVQGGAFYAVWDEEKGLWSRDEYDVQILVDKKLHEEVEKLTAKGIECDPKYLGSFDNGRWEKFKKFVRSVSDNSHPLDTKIVFSNTSVKKSDYASRRLPYSMAPGDMGAYEELVSCLYSDEERKKFEWAVGAIISGDAKKIQKFLVFFGGPGTGKSTILDLIAKIFGGKIHDGGYVSFFDAQALTGNGNTFATADFKDNPLVAIQHDGDLSKIETNARLNSIVSHEQIKINEKFKATYDNKINAMLFMGTNKPVQITDAKSGLIRRLIDVNPTGNTIETDRYHTLVQRIDFELGAIAHHCLQVYRSMGKNAYGEYEPESMMLRTNVFLNFVDEHHDVFKAQDGTTLNQAWELYKVYCSKAELPYKLTLIRFREELKDYFDDFYDRAPFDGVSARKVYKGFKSQKFRAPIVDTKTKQKTFSLVMEDTESLLDEMYAGLPAQYASAKGTPAKYWDDEEERLINGKMKKPKANQICTTVLGDLDTSKLHFVKVPLNHIVIDFDLEDDDGNKSLERNREAASNFPHTYAEISKSGTGVHLHYIYDGDVDELANEYVEGIEIKVYRGNGSLRRKLTKCNNVSVATINSGLPLREKKMIQPGTLKTEKGLRQMIIKNLRKEYHPGTKPSIDFIEYLLREAHRSGMVYDVSDMRPAIMAFANNSTNQASACLKAVARMDFKSELTDEEVNEKFDQIIREERLVFFDCEVYPNLFVICWKYQGSDTVVRMINPTPTEVENLVQNFKLVGFHNRGYDNHILWGRMLGMINEELYRLSQKLIDNDRDATFGGAWNVSYADVYDFSSDKKGLKKWEIELGIPHMEMDIPWDQPVPENKILKVVEYCCNDVRALEAVFNHCHQDFVARQILADMSGLTVNHSTRQHVMRILFGDDRNEAKKKFVYTDLSEMFPGYKFDPYSKTEKSTYRGEVVGEGGYVYAEPGIYTNVAVLDIASMHPTSIIELNLFGPYTETFRKLLEARLALKHNDRDRFNELLPGVQYPETEEESKALSNALKLVLNSTYGYTCAKFDNEARDPRNVDNIVAKRGALFMVDLKNAVQEQGFTVAHIKTDSIKIPNATPDIIAFVQEFGAKYGYTFEHEATYEKMCLVNDAVLIASYLEPTNPHAKEGDAVVLKRKWKAVGAEFQHPYVFKALFTGESITFKDLCETKQVKEGAMYLRFEDPETLNSVSKEIGEPKEETLRDELTEADPNYGDTHIGRSGLFVPINPDQDVFMGGQLLRIKDGKEYAVTGTKGYLWAEAEMIRTLNPEAIDRMVFECPACEAVEGTGSIADVIDMSYYARLAEEAQESIEKFIGEDTPFASFDEFAA